MIDKEEMKKTDSNAEAAAEVRVQVVVAERGTANEGQARQKKFKTIVFLLKTKILFKGE